MKIAILSTPNDFLFHRVGRSLAIQTVGLGDVLSNDHEVHVVTRTDRRHHSWMIHSLKGSHQVVDNVHYHFIPPGGEVEKQVKKSGGLSRATQTQDFALRFLDKSTRFLKELKPDVILVWNSWNYLSPLRVAFPGARIIAWDTRGWSLGVGPDLLIDAWKQADVVLAPTEFLGSALREHVSRSVSIDVLPLGVAADLFRAFVPRGRLPRKRDLTGGQADLLLYVGAIEEVKGAHRILEAYGELSKGLKFLHLFLMGNNSPGSSHTGKNTEDYVKDLVAKAQTLGAKVHLTVDESPQPNVADIMSAADLVICPDTLAPYTCQTVIEAMASGVPVIATKHGAHVERVNHDFIGRLFAPEDDESMIQGCIEIASSPPQERYENGLKAREIAVTEYAFESVGSRLVDFMSSRS